MGWQMDQSTSRKDPLQDGKPEYSKRHNCQRRLDGPNRSEGCLFPCTSGKNPATLSTIQMEKSGLQIQMHAFWNFLSPTDLHKIDESSTDKAEVGRNKDNRLHQ